MTRRSIPSNLARRAAALAAGLTLGVAVLAGCSSEGASTDCGLDQCTVTFDRGVEAKASVLGVDATFVGADDDVVTIEVAGERVSLTIGQQATQVSGLWVSVESADDKHVAIRIGRNPT